MSFLRRAVPALPAAALAFGLAACEPDLAPPFEPEGTGSIAGRLFFDADEDGLFTPTRGDTVLADVPIEVRVRGTEEVIEETETDVGGYFQVDGIPVGTHDVYVVATEETVGDLVVCGNPLQADVYRNEEAFVTPVGTLACVIDIVEAEALPLDELAFVVGIVTAAPGTYRGDNLYVQDETGGIQVFGVTTPGLVLGDVVEVQGIRGTFFGEVQFTNSPTVDRIGQTTVPTPEVVDAGTLGAITDPLARLVGMLVTVEAVTVGPFGFGGQDRNAQITDATGTTQLRLDGNALEAIGTAAFAENECYDITGIAGIFSGAVQLKPRLPSDIAEVTCPQ